MTVRIDGSLFEGGGAMLRQALGFSMLLQKPFVIENIRKNREKPGLSWQHLACINAAHQACNAKVEGNVVGATKVSFDPGSLTKTTLTIDIGTAGSTTLLLQSFLLPALFSGKNFSLTISGGTDVNWSIPVDYAQHVLLPQLKKFGEVSLRVLKRGFYPKGGGTIVFSSKKKYVLGDQLPKIRLVDQGDLFKIAGMSLASTDLVPSRVAERQAEATRVFLSKEGVMIDLIVSYVATKSTGTNVVLWAICGGKEGLDPLNPVILGASMLGERELKAEKVGEKAATLLREVLSSGAACDDHLADQLIPFLALCGGSIKVMSITDHVRSNMYIAEQFLGVSFIINEETNCISCEPAIF